MCLAKKILILVYKLPSTTGTWIITKETPPNASFSALKEYCSFAPYFMPLDKMVLWRQKTKSWI